MIRDYCFDLEMVLKLDQIRIMEGDRTKTMPPQHTLDQWDIWDRPMYEIERFITSVEE